MRDFIKHKAHFDRFQLHYRYHPAYQDRPYAFYHMTHTGLDEDNRLPDLRRCERMPWTRLTIEEAGSRCGRRGRYIKNKDRRSDPETSFNIMVNEMLQSYQLIFIVQNIL